MLSQLPNDLLDAFAKLAESGAAIGDKPYIVGGFVRDWIYGLPIEEVNDMDVITEFGNSEALVTDLTNRFGLGEPIQYDFTQTKRLIINGYIFEFQSDLNPNVHFPIEGDLKKMGIEVNYFNKNIFERDFTIDSICYDVTENEIVDLTGGAEDLLINQLIKTPIEAKKAIEYNPLIILRAIRLALEFNLTPEKSFREMMPYGVQLLRDVEQKRSTKFIQEIIRDIFSYDEVKADKIFNFYGLYDILPMPKELMDRKVKSDMGIVYQAQSDNLLSIEIDNNAKVVKVGFIYSDIENEENKNAMDKAIADLYLNEKIDRDYAIKFLGDSHAMYKLSEIGNIRNAVADKNWYKIAQSNIHLYDRHQRRQEYRNRKRREQKRDRIDKIKSWRNFMSNYAGGR
jgi:tRNA nucleotidyltransferase/poly(A) polymerase